MKKLFFMLAALFFLASCTEKEVIETGKEIIVKNPVNFQQKSLPCFGMFDDSNCSESNTCCLGEIVIGPSIAAQLDYIAGNYLLQHYFFSYYEKDFEEAVDPHILAGLMDSTYSLEPSLASMTKRYFSVYKVATDSVEKMFNFTVQH